MAPTLWVSVRTACMHGFSKMLCMMPFHAECTRVLNFENVCCALQGADRKIYDPKVL